MERTPPTGELTRFERLALGLGRVTNERALLKKLQYVFLRSASHAWIQPAMAPRMYVDNIDYLLEQPSDRGVVFACNHRTYYDAYLYMLAMYDSGAEWPTRIFFPVRSNFFYENPAGLLVNYAIGGGVMYPPIFRDSSKSEYNKDALERIASFLDDPATLVGLHPEGTRNKGVDPYQLLPAQPGIGQIVLKAKSMVVPIFINGVTNDFVSSIRESYRPNVRRTNPCVVVFGEPVEYGDLTAQKPRAALYKRCSDRIRDAIAACGEREREIRAACARGEVGDDDAGWLQNRARANRARGGRWW